MPCLSELHYNSIYKYRISISFIYYSNLENSIFSSFLFCPLWRPIIILRLVSRLGYITLGIGYNSQSLSFWESERVLTTNLEISTNKEDIYI